MGIVRWLGSGELNGQDSLSTGTCMGQGPHIARKHMDLGFCQSVFLRRHDIAFTLVDHLHDGLLTPTVQPCFIGQVGGADAWIAFSVDAMARGAHGELGFA